MREKVEQYNTRSRVRRETGLWPPCPAERTRSAFFRFWQSCKAGWDLNCGRCMCTMDCGERRQTGIRHLPDGWQRIWECPAR